MSVKANLDGDHARLLQLCQRVLNQVGQVVRQVPVAGALQQTNGNEY